MNLFKGYVPTRDKKCLTTFKNKTSDQLSTYEQVKDLPEFAGILNDEIILIDIDESQEAEVLFKIIDDLQFRCRVYQTSRGMHFLFKNTIVETCKTHTKLACGLTADIKLGSRNSYSILKFDNKEREILYDKFDDEEYQELPKWLLPVKTKVDFINMQEGDGRNQSLFNYILTLQSAGFSAEEARECIHIINKYILKEPLKENELDVIIRDEAFQKPIFFEKNKFLFDKFANFLISQLHLIKINGQLRMYKDGVYIDGYNQIEAEMIKYIPNLNRQRRNEVLAYIEICITKNTQVSPADYIAFKNGIYNVKTDEFIDFNTDIIITNKINYNYNQNAYNEIVDKTLNKLACNDKEIRLLLEEVVGYCFYRRNELRKSFILIGDKSNR